MRGGGSLSLFLSFFHFPPPCFCNLSSVASPSLSLVTSERKVGGLPVSAPVCLSLVGEVTLLYFSFIIQLNKNRGRWLWIRHTHDSFAVPQWKDVWYFFPPLQFISALPPDHVQEFLTNGVSNTFRHHVLLAINECFIQIWCTKGC